MHIMLLYIFLYIIILTDRLIPKNFFRDGERRPYHIQIKNPPSLFLNKIHYTSNLCTIHSYILERTRRVDELINFIITIIYVLESKYIKQAEEKKGDKKKLVPCLLGIGFKNRPRSSKESWGRLRII